MIYIYDHAFWWDDGEDLKSRKNSQNDNGAENLSCFKRIWIKQIKVVVWYLIIYVHDLEISNCIFCIYQ
jgi:hypothetical protein